MERFTTSFAPDAQYSFISHQPSCSGAIQVSQNQSESYDDDVARRIRSRHMTEAQHKRALKLYRKGYNYKEISEKLGLSYGVVSGWAIRNGLVAQFKRRRTPEEEHQFRLSLYNQGLNDVEIGKRVGFTAPSIRNWRMDYGLAPNHRPGAKGITKKQHQERMVLYRKGLSDLQMAAELGKSGTTIRQWRLKHNLKVNKQYKTQSREKLYLQGYSDAEIARIDGVTTNAVCDWRRARGMKPNEQNKTYKREQLYLQGYSDAEIARMEGVSQNAIKHWRKSRGLKRNKDSFQIDCLDCRKTFVTGHHAVRRCPECQAVYRNIKREQWIVVGNLQSEFSRLCKINPKKAKEFYEQIWIAEGQEFTRAILGKLYDEFCV